MTETLKKMTEEEYRLAIISGMLEHGWTLFQKNGWYFSRPTEGRVQRVSFAGVMNTADKFGLNAIKAFYDQNCVTVINEEFD